MGSNPKLAHYRWWCLPARAGRAGRHQRLGVPLNTVQQLTSRHETTPKYGGMPLKDRSFFGRPRVQEHLLRATPGTKCGRIRNPPKSCSLCPASDSAELSKMPPTLGGPADAQLVSAARRQVHIDPTRCAFPQVHLLAVTAREGEPCDGGPARELIAAGRA